MGRPIKKTFFGNLNRGTNSSGDDGIGGEGVASINITNLGSFRGNNTGGILDGLVLPAPTLPSGVQATWDIVYEVESVTTGAGSVGLVVGDTYTFAGTGNAVFTVATTPLGGNATFTVTNRGTGISSLPADTQTVNMTKVSGSGVGTFVVDINFRIKSLAITTAGSGYTGAETFTVTMHSGAAGTPPAGTLVLQATQQNAIGGVAYVQGGSSAVAYDIIKQEASHRYLVKTAQGEGQCKLVAASPNAGEMTIIATDSLGSTYYVTKLTARRANLTRKTNGGSGYEYNDGDVAGWSLSAATTGFVSIANA